MATKTRLTPKQAQLLEAIREGAALRYAGWQQIDVRFPLPEFGCPDPRNYTAREQTLYALRDRGLVKVDKDGIRLA